MYHQFLHRGMVWCGGLCKSLNVGVDKTDNLKVVFFQEALRKCGDQTHGQFALKENNGSKHTELWLKMLVHIKLNNHVLNLNHKRQSENICMQATGL